MISEAQIGATGTDWHAVSLLRDRRQKQSTSVNSAAVRLRALGGSCRLPYPERHRWDRLSEVDASRCFPERLEFHSSDREGCTGEKQRFEMDRSCKDNRQWEK